MADAVVRYLVTEHQIPGVSHPPAGAWATRSRCRTVSRGSRSAYGNAVRVSVMQNSLAASEPTGYAGLRRVPGRPRSRGLTHVAHQLSTKRENQGRLAPPQRGAFFCAGRTGGRARYEARVRRARKKALAFAVDLPPKCSRLPTKWALVHFPCHTPRPMSVDVPLP